MSLFMCLGPDKSAAHNAIVTTGYVYVYIPQYALKTLFYIDFQI
jgi:hypothetical protein